MLGIGVPMTPELGGALPGALDRLHDAMEPWSAEGGYLNFAERSCASTRCFRPRPASGWRRSSVAGIQTG